MQTPWPYILSLYQRPESWLKYDKVEEDINDVGGQAQDGLYRQL